MIIIWNYISHLESNVQYIIKCEDQGESTLILC